MGGTLRWENCSVPWVCPRLHESVRVLKLIQLYTKKDEQKLNLGIVNIKKRVEIFALFF